jgi:hypothetical protein
MTWIKVSDPTCRGSGYVMTGCPTTMVCPTCRGSGICQSCNGGGQVGAYACSVCGGNGTCPQTITCDLCHGYGQVRDAHGVCSGTGYVDVWVDD